MQHSVLQDVHQARVEISAEPINIILASDEPYLPYTAVTLASLLTNLSDPRRVAVYLLTDAKLSPLHRSRFLKLMSIRDFSLEEVVINAERFASIRTTPGISAVTYYRLTMHEVLPKHVRRALYLDSDLLVLGNVAELYDTDLSGFMFAGVEDSVSHHYNAKFNLPKETPHINAGVAMVNLQEMREGEFTRRVSDYIQRNRYLITLGDQQIINAACHDKIRYVPLKWNVHGSMFDSKWVDANTRDRNGFTTSMLKQAVSKPDIVHYTLSSRKPWLSTQHPKAKEWLTYAERTPYGEEILRSIPLRAAAAKPAPVSKPKPKSSLPWHFHLRQRMGGYWKSVRELRKTRLSLERLQKQLNVSASASPLPPQASIVPPDFLLDALSSELLARIGRQRLSVDFSAEGYVRGLQCGGMFLTNQVMRDLDGGYHENLKTVLRTSNIARDVDISEATAVLILVVRARDEMYWRCLNYGASYGKDVIFTEGSFFGAFANYFDEKFSGIQRKSFGFILDDMSFYFDARNPSRLETFLNSDDAVLPHDQVARSRRLIKRVISERLTKYNAYAGLDQSYRLPKDMVLVIDQKAGDASIELGGATAKTFELMTEAAIKENPGRPVCFKVHPDNRDRANGKYRSAPANVSILPDDLDITAALDACSKVYTVTSQVGFEGILRGKEVHVFGQPFYAGWGLTKDRQRIPRRTRRATIEELFHAACIRHSVYVDPRIGQIVSIEKAFDFVRDLRARMPSKPRFW